MSTQDNISRAVLPIPDQPCVGLTTYDAKDPDTKFPPIEQLRPPKGAPNVLIILIDDAGFGSSSAFGGPCQTPNAEKLAAGGLKYNRFHTTALCSPTRQALLTGRNHHSAGMGGITEIATGAPGYSSVLPNTISPLARTLKLNGYSTAQFGKCHEVPVWETSPVGPFDAWPTGGGGFEYFYGFIGGEANQWYPTLYEGTTPVEPKKTPEEGYHFMEDMTDKAMAWIAQQKALAPDKPFFVYFAPGATHAPHHVPKEWADKYKGKFDQGWDKLREETFARQKKLGVIPADCRAHRAPQGDPGVGRHAGGAEADAAPPDGSLRGLPGVHRPPCRPPARWPEEARHPRRHADLLHHRRQRRLGRGHAERHVQRDAQLQRHVRPRDAGVPQWRGSTSSAGRSPTTTTPSAGRMPWTRPTSGPSRSPRTGAGRATAPSCTGRTGSRPRARCARSSTTSSTSRRRSSRRRGCPSRSSVNGVQQRPIEGVSMLYSFNDAKAAERHETQYFEMFGNRGIYHKGWTAVTRHKTPWLLIGEKTPAFDDDVWELYDTEKDWSQANDLSKQMPEKLHELQRLWLIEASRTTCCRSTTTSRSA